MNNINKIPPTPPQNLPSLESEKWEEIRKKLEQLNNIPIKPYSLKELAGIYKVSVPTFKKMLVPFSHKIGCQIGRFYSITQVKQILRCIDQPSSHTLKSLALLYQVSIPTYKGWLDRFQHELGEKTGHYFSYRQLYIIIIKLDVPSIEGNEQEDFTLLLRLCT